MLLSSTRKTKLEIHIYLENGGKHSKELCIEVLDLLFVQDSLVNLSSYKLSPSHETENSTPHLLHPDTGVSG